MFLRAILIFALLTQQLAVWPCLSVCRLLGDCVGDVSSCDGPRECAAACERPATCARACESSCEVACDAPTDWECGPICYLACASAAAQPLEQGQPPAPRAPHIDLINLLALPAAFIAWIDRDQLASHTPSVQWTWRSAWTASHRRSVLCRWII